MTGVRKPYQSLRPLRIADLSVQRGERVAISGLDAGSAEVLVNLVTGASVPDEGEVLVFGRSTASIVDGDEWLAWLDQFGIMTPRAVLLGAATLEQNLAMPITLDIDPIKPDVAARVLALARETGIDPGWLPKPIAGLPAGVTARVHLARSIAMQPALLILEHPSADLPAADRQPFGATVAAVTGARALTTLIISNDEDFNTAAAPRRLALQPASGALSAPRRKIFGF
jgi:ABC-type transporter Mla maintaining outer membrane lipid asymmetry ATPase subunit MlaF